MFSQVVTTGTRPKQTQQVQCFRSLLQFIPRGTWTSQTYFMEIHQTVVFTINLNFMMALQEKSDMYPLSVMKSFRSTSWFQCLNITSKDLHPASVATSRYSRKINDNLSQTGSGRVFKWCLKQESLIKTNSNQQWSVHQKVMQGGRQTNTQVSPTSWPHGEVCWYLFVSTLKCFPIMLIKTWFLQPKINHRSDRSEVFPEQRVAGFSSLPWCKTARRAPTLHQTGSSVSVVSIRAPQYRIKREVASWLFFCMMQRYWVNNRLLAFDK